MSIRKYMMQNDTFSGKVWASAETNDEKAQGRPYGMRRLSIFEFFNFRTNANEQTVNTHFRLLKEEAWVCYVLSLCPHLSVVFLISLANFFEFERVYSNK